MREFALLILALITVFSVAGYDNGAEMEPFVIERIL